MSTAAVRSFLRLSRPATDLDALLAAVADRNNTAFDELVRRYGPMVLGVCRRVLGPSDSADDAFQTTFLALVRHAGSIRTPAALPGWLHRTALRTALKIKPRTLALILPEPAVHPDPLADLSWREVRALLDAELDRLPADLRGPVVLCYLDGHTRDDAAAALGVSLSTANRRLARGLEVLRERLTRRGLSGVAVAAAAVGGGLTAQVPPALSNRLTAAFAALPTAAGLPSFLTGWKAAASLVLLLGGLTTAGVLLTAPAGQVKAPPAAPSEKPDKPKADAGEALPDGALLRLGSTHFRHAGVEDFVLLPDGKSVLTAGTDQFLRTWDLATGRETRKVTVAGSVKRLGSFSPDGRFAAAFVGGNLAVYDTGTGKELASVPSPTEDPHSTFFSPDGLALAVLGWAPQLYLIDWKTKKQQELPLPARRIGKDSTLHGYFSPDGKWVVAGGGHGESVCVFDVAAKEEKHRFSCSAIRTTITPDGKTLVAAVGRELATFDLKTGRETARFNPETEESFFSLDVSPDGATAVCSFSNSSCLVDLKTGRVLHKLPDHPIYGVFSRDGKSVVATTGQQLRVWNVADVKERFEHLGNLSYSPVLAVSPDGRRLASVSWLDKYVTVWDLTTGRVHRTLPLKGEQGRYAVELGFTPDGRTLWSGQYKGFVHWWDTATWKETRTVQLATPDPTALRDLDYLFRARVSADGKTAAALGRVWTQTESTGLAVWDIETGKLKGSRALPANQTKWAWPTGVPVVALTTQDGLVVADAENPSRTRYTIPGVPANSPVVASTDGRLLAARKHENNEQSREVIVIDTATGQTVVVLKTGLAEHLALSADGRTLVVAADDALKVFDVATGVERGRRPLPVRADGLILSDDTRALTALKDGTGLVWDLTAFPATAKPAGAAVATLWDALAGGDAAAAYKAGWELADRPAEAVALLREKLKPAKAADAAAVTALVTKLDDKDFATREAASKALLAFGDTAVSSLQAAIKGELSAEQTERVERVLAAAKSPVLTGERLREVRAVAVLERVGSADARKLLDELAGGLPDARLTKEAAAVGRGKK
jgi:RNA polymerase sigma factor (sigma-70 family)